jgi:probable HAF family extracellular repeat protein
MIPASDPRDRTERTPSPRRGPLVKRRASFRPELETVEDRRLLSSYTVTDMTFPGGYLIEAAAINDLGQVAGRGSAPNFASAVIWQNGSITPLDPQPNGGSEAIDLTNPGNAADVKVVGYTGPKTVFIWDHGTMYDTSLSESTYFGWDLAISNSGVVAGGYHPGGDQNQNHAYVWKDINNNHQVDAGEFQDLHSLIANGSATQSSATDIVDASGPGDHRKVLVDAIVPAPGGDLQRRAFLLTENDLRVFDSAHVTDLNPLPGAPFAQAVAINDVGQVAGISDIAFRWQNGVVTNLGQLNGVTGRPGAINHGGQIVGATSEVLERAWVWTGNGSIKDLNTLIPRKTGWFLQDARGINDAGQIVGLGQHPNVNRAFLLTPISAPTGAVSTAAASLNDARTPSQSPVEALVQPTLPRTFVPPAAPGPQDSLILIPLTPVTDQDLTLVATELIHSGAKRPRASFWS